MTFRWDLQISEFVNLIRCPVRLPLRKYAPYILNSGTIVYFLTSRCKYKIRINSIIRHATVELWASRAYKTLISRRNQRCLSRTCSVAIIQSGTDVSIRSVGIISLPRVCRDSQMSVEESVSPNSLFLFARNPK